MISLGTVFAIIALIMGGIGAYYMWQWGGAITTGIQQAAPALGAMISAVGMVFAMMPIIIMMMFMYMFINMFMGLVR